MFKVGDRVYYPTFTSKIGTITSVKPSDKHDLYPVKIEFSDQVIFVSEEGKFNIDAPVTAVYFANDDTYNILCKLYPSAKFEKPKQVKEAQEIIQAMLDDNHQFLIFNDGVDFQVYPRDEILEIIDDFNSEMRPFDLETGKVIIDYIDGKPITW